jgi:hypothetical protein
MELQQNLILIYESKKGYFMNNTVIDLFNIREDYLISNYKLTSSHAPTDGKYREYLVESILDFIPKHYSTCNGFVFDSEGTISKEIDIIIFDAINVPRFFTKTYNMIPIESVVAIVQVKSKLTKTELNNACENLDSINEMVQIKGGEIKSANGTTPIVEKRNIGPLKILVAGNRNTVINNECASTIDIIFCSGKKKSGILRIRKQIHGNLVSLDNDMKSILDIRKKNNEYDYYRLYNFAFSLMSFLTRINNSLIINYSHYQRKLLKET